MGWQDIKQTTRVYYIKLQLFNLSMLGSCFERLEVIFKQMKNSVEEDSLKVAKVQITYAADIRY